MTKKTIKENNNSNEKSENEYVTVNGAKYEVIDGKLNLDDKEISNISQIKGLDKLKTLRKLRLNRNQISEISGLETLTSLEELSLFSNQITELKGLDTLTSLEILWIPNNQISEISGLEKLSSLQGLDISNNNITEIKGLETLTSLDELLLSKNEISEIKGLDTLTNLISLDLDDNKITEIKGLNELTSLKYLHLNNNQITEIKGLENIPSLADLYLSNNKISEIKNLEQHTMLELLYLENNQITEIKGLETLKNLLELGLGGNNFDGLDDLDFYLEDLDFYYLDDPQQVVKYCQRKQNLKGLGDKNGSMNLRGLYSINWAMEDTAYGGGEKIPEYLKKLYSTTKDEVFGDTMWELYGYLCHQGTIYGATTRSIKFFWLILKHHLEQNKIGFVLRILSFFKSVMLSENFYYEPLGFKYDDKDGYLNIAHEIFKELDLFWDLLESDELWFQDAASSFLRYCKKDEMKIIKKFHEMIPETREIGLLRNLLYRLALKVQEYNAKNPELTDAQVLLDELLGDQSIYINFLHPDYPYNLRLTSLICLLILSRGDLPDPLAKEVSMHFSKVNDYGQVDHDRELFKSLELESWIKHKRTQQEEEILQELKEKEATVQFSTRFHNLERYNRVFYVVNGRVNPILKPAVSSCMKVPEEMIEYGQALQNITEAMISLVFPKGFLKTLETQEELDEDQVNFIKNAYKGFPSYKDVSGYLNILEEGGFGRNKQELYKIIEKFPCSSQFGAQIFLSKIDPNINKKYKFDEANNLIELELSDYKKENINEIGEIFGNLSYLENLKLWFKEIKELPKSIGSLQSLKRLEISIDALETLPDTIGSLKTLKELKIRSSSLETLPNTIGSLESLESLDLSTRALVQLPDSLGKLDALKSLKLYSESMNELPDCIGMLPNLEELELYRIKTFSNIFNGLKKLKKLDLMNTKHPISFPDTFNNLPSLENLFIDRVASFSFPDNIGNLSMLKSLYITESEIKYFPASIGKLRSLEELIYRDAPLASIPDSIGNLSNLKELKIINTSITSIPESIGKIKTLEKLDISKNQITNLPDSLGRLKLLTRLNVENNEITELPNSLPLVEYLYYAGNPVEKSMKFDLDLIKKTIQENMDKIRTSSKTTQESMIETVKDILRSGSPNILKTALDAARAEFLMIEGDKVDNIEMMYDAMVDFANVFVFRRDIPQLKEYFSEGELFNDAKNFLMKIDIDAESIIKIMNNAPLLNSGNPMFQKREIENIYNRCYFYLRNELNYPFCLASGQVIRDFGKRKELIDWENKGNEIIAQIYTLSEDIEKVKKAVEIYDELERRKVGMIYHAHKRAKEKLEKLKKER